MSDDPEICLRLPVSSVVKVLNALADGRYSEVAELIEEIRRQGLAQLGLPAPLPPEPVPVEPRTDSPTLN